MTRSTEPADFERGWRRRFGRFADKSDDDAGIAGWSPSGLATRVRQFGRLWADRRRQGLWLDAGCGAGTYARMLDAGGLRILGTDYSEQSLVKAAARSPGSILWCACDVRALPLRDASFDGVICFGVTQALMDSRLLVGELVRVVKPGGEIWIDGLNRGFVMHRLRERVRKWRGEPLYLRYESAENLMALLRDNGVQDISMHWLPIVPGSLGWMQGCLESGPVRSFLHRAGWMGSLLSHSLLIAGRKGEKHVTPS